jgi:hypothetical protein
MLGFLDGSASDRKLCLFAIDCYRRHRSLLEDDKAIAVLERFAHGVADEAEWDPLGRSLDANRWLWPGGWPAACPVRDGDAWLAWRASGQAIGTAGVSAAPRSDRSEKANAARSAAREIETTKQVRVLRCIFGNPFKRLRPAPDRLAGGGAIRNFAQAIYYDRCVSDLPFLADALEEAGCDDADILDHCRGTAEHVRGCWVVDWVLGFN